MSQFISIIIVAFFLPSFTLSAQDAFWDIFGESEVSETEAASGTNIEVSGIISTDFISFFDASKIADNEVLAIPEAVYTDIINELYMRTFFSFGYLEAGLMKV